MCDGCCSVSKMTTKKVARKLRANVVVRGGAHLGWRRHWRRAILCKLIIEYKIITDIDLIVLFTKKIGVYC